MVKQRSNSAESTTRGERMAALAGTIMHRCDVLGACSDDAGRTTRVFCSPAMRDAHHRVAPWMHAAGMTTCMDAAGNLRGLYCPPGCDSQRRVVLGSHLDTVVDAGRYDGILGVMLGIAAVQAVRDEQAPLPWAVEVIGFSDEEGVRFGTPFLGSRALAGTLDAATLRLRDSRGVSVSEALNEFGVDPAGVADCAVRAGDVVAYVEVHIEQGPQLERLNLPLGVVTAIAGQTRLSLHWTGDGGHAGAVPMEQRRDPLVPASRWIAAVEHAARETPGLVATVGRVDVEPNAVNCIPRRVLTSLDIRHDSDAVRLDAVRRLCELAGELARQSHVTVDVRYDHEHNAVALDTNLTARLAQAAAQVGAAPLHMVSGAGHDAGVIAAVAPSALLFVRSPGGVSHDPAEAVATDDVAAALDAVVNLIESLATT